MQFLTSLFGGSGNELITALLALGLVLVMIVAGLWLLKLVFKASSSVARGRTRRISVVDSLYVDPKRQLLIVRRDDVEHLILTGGTQDVVVETGIAVKEQPAPARRPVPAPAPAAAPMPVPVPVPPMRAKTIVPGRPKTFIGPAPVPPAPALPAEGEAAPTARNSVERLRDLARPAGMRTTSHSLRHTGLMRPVSRMDPNRTAGLTENSAAQDADSATSGPVEPRGRQKGGDGNFGAYRGDIKADGNS